MSEASDQNAVFSDIPSVVEDFRRGRFVIVVDDEDRENEGDLCIAAEHATAEAVTFLINHARGFLCLAIGAELAEKLELPPMVADNRSQFGTPFTVTVDAREGITTGVSAADRAHTIRTMLADDARPEDLVRPGHVLPLLARPGGTLVRAAHTEAAVDLARLAGLKPAAAICEVMNADGTMAKLPQLAALAREHGFKICSIADLIRYRHQSEYLVCKSVSVALPTRYGDFRLHYYRSIIDERQHAALCCGGIGTPDDTPAEPLEEPVLVRVHDECFTGDIFHSHRCDCGEQLEAALEMIQREGRGVLLYMRQEGRGIADKREYGVGAQILRHLGVRKMRLLSNNPRKFHALGGYGLEIVERVPLEVPPRKENLRYLLTKKEKMGHMLNLHGDAEAATDPGDPETEPGTEGEQANG